MTLIAGSHPATNTVHNKQQPNTTPPPTGSWSKVGGRDTPGNLGMGGEGGEGGGHDERPERDVGVSSVSGHQQCDGHHASDHER